MKLTDDAFLGGALSILQPEVGYRAGTDAVLLAAAVPVRAGAGERVLDAGAGVGVVGIAIAARAADAHVTLAEIDCDLAGLARRNADRNGIGSRVDVVVADIGAGGRLLHDAKLAGGLRPGSFEHVVANPPYYAVGSGTVPAFAKQAIAHQMDAGGLARWIACLATAATSGGTLSLIYRADALEQVLDALAGRFGRVRMLPVHARHSAPAGRILVSAIKGSRAPLELLPGLVLHGDDGRFLPEVEAVLRHGAPLAV